MNTIRLNTIGTPKAGGNSGGGGGGSADIPQDLIDIINSLYLSEMNDDFNGDFAI